MPSKSRVRTYGRSKNIESNYIPKPVSPFKITEASTVIDALFSKNIRKRISSPNKNVITKKTRGRPRKPVMSVIPSPVHPMLNNDNDSLNIKINSTFDNLLQGPVYHEVNICNKSSLYVSNSTDTSNSNIISEKMQSSYNTRKRKKKNYALYSDNSHNVWEKCCNNSVSSNGKIRKKKNNPRKLKQMVNNVVINISDTTTDKHDISKKLQSYLDQSINYSLNIDRQSNQKSFSCAKKFTPIASTSTLLSVKTHNQDTNIFRHGFRHLMRAESTPRYIHSSTPIVAKNVNIDDKLNVSPIIASAKTRLNFTCNSSSKSLFESRKLNEVSSIQYIANKNNKTSVISINSTIPEIVHNIENLSKIVIIDDTIDKNNLLVPSSEKKVQLVNSNKDKIVCNNTIEEDNSNLMKNSFITNDIKLKGKAVVLLDRHLDVLGINGNASVICPKSKIDFQNEFISEVRLEKHLDGLRINGSTSVICPYSKTDLQNQLIPIVRLEKHLDILGINGNASVICPKSKTDLQNESIPVVRFKKHLDGSGINEDSNVICRFSNSRIAEENKRVPVVYLERLSISKYLTDRGLFVTSRSRNASKNSHISSKSQSIIDELSSNEISKIRRNDHKRNSEFSISKEHSTSKTFNTNEKISNKSLFNNKKKYNSKINSDERGSNIRNYKSETSTSLRWSGNINGNEQKSARSSSFKYSNANSRIVESQNISNSKSVDNEHSDIMENTSRSMFDSHCSDIIENSTNNYAPVSKNFVTTRKKRVQINTEPIINYECVESTKPPNINTDIWERISQSKVNIVRLEDCKELEKYSKLVKINDNLISDRKTYMNIDLNRKSIFLKPGKKWFRSLSILRQTNLHEIEEDKYCNKGRKWRDSVYEVFENQNDSNGAYHEIGDESVVNDMKHKIRSSKRTTLGIRKSLKIVNISVKDFSVLAEKSIHENKSGYVPSLAHVSILESFDKLSLSTNVDDREETARQIILKRCGQTDPIPFDDCYSSRTLKKCRKIGEGVYGEVFMYKSLDNKCRVIKVIPIEGNLVVNGEHQKKFEEIISEIIIASELSNLRINNEFCTNGYAELLQIACVQGKYPQHLLDLWDLFDEERGSENDSPEIFTDDQLYIVLELANGGQDLEAYRFNNAEQSYALFVQVVCSLAVAESAMQFEHRDMHWGNILISPTDESTITFRLKGREFEVATRGIKVSVIDFTLSRMTYNNCCIYNDLALDPDLFTATGDYQFDIYRLMKQRNQNDWQAFEPYTNVLWLDYTLEKMINHVRYLRVTTKTHKTYIRRLSQIRKKILNYNSVTELLNSDVFSNVFL